jgi:hypothetical protein
MPLVKVKPKFRERLLEVIDRCTQSGPQAKRVPEQRKSGLHGRSRYIAESMQNAVLDSTVLWVPLPSVTSWARWS